VATLGLVPCHSVYRFASGTACYFVATGNCEQLAGNLAAAQMILYIFYQLVQDNQMDLLVTIVILIVMCIVLPPITIYTSVQLRNTLRITQYDQSELRDAYKRQLKTSYEITVMVLIASLIIVIIAWYGSKHY
jgi:heme/copper-type cytochrome/quinol oxidase subunit 2